jgi:photosynthetic reaction center H subunit
METGAITGYIDVAQVTLYVFWVFFAGLIFYIRREDRREGYPLESDPDGRVKDRGFLLLPEPKVFNLRNGGTYTAPNLDRDTRPIAAVRVGRWPGAPMVPTGNPLVDGVGPAAWAERSDHPDQTWDGRDKIVPSRVDDHFGIFTGDPDPRGREVFAADRVIVGTVSDIWVDRSEHLIRYLEVTTAEPGTGPLLVPMNLARLTGNRVQVKSITSAQFADVPRIKSSSAITLLEEDRVMAYFTGGHLYATADRSEPLL